MRTKKNSAFTLIELVIVLAVLSIVIAGGIASYASMNKKITEHTARKELLILQDAYLYARTVTGTDEEAIGQVGSMVDKDWKTGTLHDKTDADLSDSDKALSEDKTYCIMPASEGGSYDIWYRKDGYTYSLSGLQVALSKEAGETTAAPETTKHTRPETSPAETTTGEETTTEEETTTGEETTSGTESTEETTEKAEEITAASITGKTIVGERLVASAVPSDADFTCVWQYADTEDSGSWTDIEGETGTSLTVPEAAWKKYIRLDVRGKDPYSGEAYAVSGPVMKKLPSPDISGTHTSGSVLTASSNAEENVATCQWMRSKDGASWTEISGATDTMYTLTASDVGYSLKAVFTGVKSEFYTGSVSTDPIEAEPDYVNASEDLFRLISSNYSAFNNSGKNMRVDSTAYYQQTTSTVAGSGGATDSWAIKIKKMDEYKALMEKYGIPTCSSPSYVGGGEYYWMACRYNNTGHVIWCRTDISTVDADTLSKDASTASGTTYEFIDCSFKVNGKGGDVKISDMKVFTVTSALYARYDSSRNLTGSTVKGYYYPGISLYP